MWLSTLLLGWLFATLAPACRFPFNNPRLTNSSLVEEYVADMQAKAGHGWITAIGPNSPDPIAWPKNSESGKVTYIYYCFDTHASFVALRDVVAGGSSMWRNKLGPGSTNGHHFDGFRHYYSRKTNSHPRCYTSFPDPWDWNYEVPAGTLVISYNAKGYSQSTIGYEATSPDPDRHSMTLQTWPKYEEWVIEVAHEFGHVLGLEHEHQRVDRDRALHYDCSKLEGYTEARNTIAAHPEWSFTIADACRSSYLGVSKPELQFWQPGEYTMDMGQNRQQIYGREIDYKSIMIYPSWANAADPMHGVADLPLVRWKNGPPSNGDAPNHDNADIIGMSEGITDGDKEAIQHLYPWT